MSLLNDAIHTPVDQMTDEQKQLIRDNVSALSEEEKKTFVEAGIIAAEPESKVPGELAEPGESPAPAEGSIQSEGEAPKEVEETREFPPATGSLE